MEDEKYRYLFPFEKVKPGSNIVIYGAGIVGMEYLKQIMLTNYCNVVGMADKNYNDFSNAVVPVYSPEYIYNLDPDYVVIAQRVSTYLDEIRSILSKQNIYEKKIVCILQRTEVPPVICETNREVLPSSAYQKAEISIAILASAGIGDMVIYKKFITQLIHFVPTCLIDIFYVQNGKFLEYLYSDCQNINMIVPNLGIRYSSSRSNYTIGLELVSTRYVHVDVLKAEQISSEYQGFRKKMIKFRDESEKEKYTTSTLIHTIFQRRLYRGLNAYTAFDYNGIFEIQDKHVDIPLYKEDENIFYSLKLKNYITFNFGNGACNDGSKISKMWPPKYFEQIIELFRKKYSAIEVIQLGGDEAQKIKGADRYLLGKAFGTVAHILKHSIFHLDIEGGLVHIASQLGTKCVVLFGPTPKEYLAYDNNINIIAGNCHNCFGLYDEIYKCARNMKEPECMFSITPEIVMSHIEKYMDEIGY